jgi:hypothetical protein
VVDAVEPHAVSVFHSLQGRRRSPPLPIQHMMKRALTVVATVMSVAAVLAFTVSPISPQSAWAALTAAQITEGRNTPAPHSGRKALEILHTDVMKLARDYKHKQYRAVCSDLTRKERAHLGGTSQCMLVISVLNAFVPIKKFTITATKLARNHKHGAVSLYVNGIKKHVVHAAVKWEGGQYRLDHQSGWHPKL